MEPDELPLYVTEPPSKETVQIPSGSSVGSHMENRVVGVVEFSEGNPESRSGRGQSLSSSAADRT